MTPWLLGNKKGLVVKPSLFILLIRRLLTFPGLRGPSIISHGGLNFRVRNGNGCDPSGIATGILIRRAKDINTTAEKNATICRKKWWR